MTNKLMLSGQMTAGKYRLLNPEYGDNVTLLKLVNYLPAEML
jgi:hypothetical protein